MGERRKLQGEIDRVLKRVGDGVEVFEDIWEKVQNSSNQNQKEKHEQELKKEIKKLQRLRDQIKSWLASNDIKDKTALTEARRKIENLMERFKVVERETKTKAYSKEGLGALQKLDPQRKEKDDTIQWLSQAIESLQLQTDTAEAETESIIATSKKKKDEKEKQARLETLRKRIDRNKYHIGNLEKILRLVDNDAVNMKHVNDLKDDVDHYIESNQYPDFQENDEMYSEISFDEIPMVVCQSLGQEDQNRRRASECDESSRQSAFPAGASRSNAGRSKNRISSHNSGSYGANMTRVSTGESRHLSESNCFVDSKGVYGLNGPNSAPADSDLSIVGSLEYRAKSSNNLTTMFYNYPDQDARKDEITDLCSTFNTIQDQCQVSRPESLVLERSNSHNIKYQPLIFSSDQQTMTRGNSVPSGGRWPNVFNSDVDTSFAAQASAWEDYSWQSGQDTTSYQAGSMESSYKQNSAPQAVGSPVPAAAIPKDNKGATFTAGQQTGIANQMLAFDENTDVRESTQIFHRHEQDNWNVQPACESNSGDDSLYRQTAETIGMESWSSDAAELRDVTAPTETQGSPKPFQVAAVPEPSQDVASVSKQSACASENAQSATRKRVPHPLSSVSYASGGLHMLQQRAKLANAAYRQMMGPAEDARRRLQSSGKEDDNNTSTSNSGTANVLPTGLPDFCDFFSKLSTESLFFIFYYMEGTFAQQSAAKALKKRSWRFHTKYLMWFQRHEQPKAIRDDCEQGTYIYFDFEKWVQKKKEGFTFEYRYLEDRDFS